MGSFYLSIDYYVSFDISPLAQLHLPLNSFSGDNHGGNVGAFYLFIDCDVSCNIPPLVESHLPWSSFSGVNQDGRVSL